jgi:hypothetical protein
MTKIELKAALKEVYNALEPELPEDLLRRVVSISRDNIAELIGSLVMDTREQETKLLTVSPKKALQN